MDKETEELELVAEVFGGLSNRSKLAILLGLEDDKTLKEIAEFLDITQQGLEKNVGKMMDAGLITWKSDDQQRYELTPIGEYFVGLIDREWETLLDAKRTVQGKEAEARETVESAKQSIDEEEADGFTFQIDEEAWERTVQTEKWELAENDLREILDLPAEAAKDE
jgi:DNA-binding MarR family transcriptional regulator